MKKKQALLFHVQQGDYFGTLATLLDLMRQGIVSKQEIERILEDIVCDLVCLQNHFKIVEKRRVGGDVDGSVINLET